MNSKILIGLVVLLVGAAVGWYVLTVKRTVNTSQPATPQAVVDEPSSTLDTVSVASDQSTGGAMEKGGITTKTTVNYTDNGFSPLKATVKKGTTVKFVNVSGSGMWVASDVHPTHQLLPGFDELKSAQKGGEYEYAFTKVGTWTYHNHVNPAVKGTVIVIE